MLGWRLYLGLALLALAAGTALWVGVTWSRLERNAADGARRAEIAEASASRNAAAVAELTQAHAAEMVAVTERIQAAEAERQRLETQLEALRADPSHSALAAPVLDLAVDQLRLRRAGTGGEGGPDGAPASAAGPARPAEPAAARGAPDPRPHR
jgi:hypothetical protein